MRIAIINQFAPPDESPTGVLAGELADFLRRRGHCVQLISADSGYRQRGSPRGSRVLTEMLAHLRLFWRCLGFRKPEVLLALSSPACLPVTVAAAASLKRCRFAHWAMDVYPDVAVALGELKQHGLVHRITGWAMHLAYRRAAPLVTLTPNMALALGVPAKLCPPWSPMGLEWPSVDPGRTEPFTWLYSGNLGRAHLYRPLLLAQKQLEDRGVPAHLVFQGGGHSIPGAQALAGELGLENCRFRGYAPREQLLPSLFEASVLVATQEPASSALLWPSKLAVMRHVPRPLLWVGSESPSVDAECFLPDDSAGIARWIEAQVAELADLPYSPPRRPEADLEQWHQWLTNP